MFSVRLAAGGEGAVEEKRADVICASPSSLRDRDSNPDLLIQSQPSYH